MIISCVSLFSTWRERDRVILWSCATPPMLDFVHGTLLFPRFCTGTCLPLTCSRALSLSSIILRARYIILRFTTYTYGTFRVKPVYLRIHTIAGTEQDFQWRQIPYQSIIILDVYWRTYCAHIRKKRWEILGDFRTLSYLLPLISHHFLSPTLLASCCFAPFSVSLSQTPSSSQALIFLLLSFHLGSFVCRHITFYYASLFPIILHCYWTNSGYASMLCG